MIVFEYFYERMGIFAPLIDEKAKIELGESDDEYEDVPADEEEVACVMINLYSTVDSGF